MSDEPRRFLTEEEAARLWQRAARLQAESAHRLEERSRSLAAGEDRSGEGTDGYELEVVRGAALEAGIGAEFVDRALAALEAESRAGGGGRGRILRSAEGFLGHRQEEIEVARVIQASGEKVLEGMHRVFPFPPFGLQLTDTVGTHPLDGGILVFEVPSPYSDTAALSGRFQTAVMWSDLKRLLVSLRELERTPPATEVLVRAPLEHSKKLNLYVGGGVAGIGAGLGGWLGVAAAAAAAAGLGASGLAALALAGVAAVGFGGAGGVGTREGYRLLYRYALRQGEKGLAELLRVLDVNVRSGGGFTQAPRPPAAGEDGWRAGALGG